MLIVLILLFISAALSLATVVEVIKELLQENHMVTLATEKR